ncbi:alpha/beta hydrolase [[Mycobacterium] wendilense]|uniref:Alpha/beta hydrolase n=1 Tax=[Mycobacterium] wendilense TaxID=3064284 RepID=A0ABN9NZG7_9MYCO|nr:alpha/beta hydrolase [Mycolicibacterium sp. MU0050]CAJ1583374.1 alpha/beta hydrolase [Mycolicibacterium sp. MU0050]
MSGSTSRRAFLGTGLALLAGLGGAAACAGTARQRAAPLPAPVATDDFLVYQDLPYAAPVGRGHLLDIYLPPAADGPVPVVIHHLGSAFRSDDTKGDALPPPPSTTQQAAPAAEPTPAPASVPLPFDPASLSGMIGPRGVASWLVPRGYAVVGLNVRSSSQVKFPGQVHDVKAAIRYLRANANACGLDPDRFVTMGNSSGGWVATMAALTAGAEELEGDLGNGSQSSAVKAVVDLYGPTDFLAMDAHRLPHGDRHDGADSPESELMGFAIQTDPEAVRKANPAAYVRAGSPPAFIAHGMADPLVPFNQSEILFDAYERARVSANLTLIPGVGHTDGYLSDPGHSPGRTVRRTRNGSTTTGTEPAPTFETLVAFLDTHLGRLPSPP